MAAPSPAVEEIVLRIGRVDGGTWSSGDLVLELGLRARGRLSFRLRADGLTLPAPFASLSTVSVDCPQAEATAAGLVCGSAELRLGRTNGDRQRLPLSMHLDQTDGAWQLRLTAGRLEPGSLWAFAAGQGLHNA